MRIVSLLASATEIVCALGAGEWLVGRSHECDNPAWVTRLPVCTSPVFDVTMSSGAIDAEVRRRLKAGEPLYHVHAEVIDTLEPDLLLTQEHCDVCAVTPRDVERVRGARQIPQMLSLSANSLADIDASVRLIAAHLGLTERGEKVIGEEQARRARVHAAVAHYERPTVVVLEWTDPPFAMGNWGPELVELAGGIPLLAEPGQYSRPVAWEEVVAADPDYLVIAPCGFAEERSAAELNVLSQYPGWESLRAVRLGRVTFADGNRLFNRSGMTVTDTLEWLSNRLHPEAEITL